MASSFQAGRDTGSLSETTTVPTVIVSTPGPVESSLRAMLQSLPSVQVVGSAAGCLSALHMAREMGPALLVLDSNLPDQDVLALVQQLKLEPLPTRSLVLTTTRSQKRRALEAGADATFRRDGPIVQLRAIVSSLGATNHGEGAEP